jgi:predicted Rossmann fold nucleotide-binding protein DprA/Smf involved in DNA uptake
MNGSSATGPLSANAQAILLLTAPLLVGQRESTTDLLTPGEYRRLARALFERQREPADLLGPDAGALVAECGSIVERARLDRLIARGFLLGQAIEKWQARSIWVVSRADPEYPQRLRARLKDHAPPILYGCGEAANLKGGGLAVVGSRQVSEELVEYTENVGQLAALSGVPVVSGGARGIDQAAMRGALSADGKVAGVLADSLERAALHRDHRGVLRDGRLVLISPYDPASGFNVGHAMQRNKVIYALADAALVVSSDLEKGGTWAGAIEQLELAPGLPLYVRATGEPSRGLEALGEKGALPWPEPKTPHELAMALAVEIPAVRREPEQAALPFVA